MTATHNITLKQSKVVFDEFKHTYRLGRKKLEGITSTLIRRAFPDTYKDIPEAVLAKAAERGGMIHNSFELFCTVCNADIKQYPSPTEEILALNSMLLAHGLSHVASEYLVTDNKHFASAVDAVFADSDGNIYLADYKTTSTLHYDNVSLQLSIYARWFEQMNPRYRVKELVCMWFKNGQSKFQPLPRVPDDKIDELIRAYLEADESYRYVVEIPEQFSALEQEYRIVTEQIDALVMRQNAVKEQLLNLMQSDKRKSIKTAYASYAYVAASTVKRFDSRLFRESVSDDEYNKYLKEVSTKPSIRIKLN